MAHDKVYGFCEAKCKVEVVDKAEFDEYIPKDGTEGQVWTSDGNGAGKWIDLPGLIVKTFTMSGTISGLTNKQSGSTSAYKVSVGYAKTLISDDSSTVYIFSPFTSTETSGTSSKTYSPGNSRVIVILTDILKTVFRISDFSEMDDGTYVVTIGFGSDNPSVSGIHTVTLVVSGGVGTVSTNGTNIYGTDTGESYWKVLDISRS